MHHHRAIPSLRFGWRLIAVVLYAALIVFGFGDCHQPAYAAETAPQIEVKVPRDDTLDHLFDELRLAPDEETADQISNRIYARLRKSGSDTLDVMMVRGREAMGKGELPVATEIFSRIIALDPAWAEAWNMRASAFFMMGDNARATSDAIETLAREPRHFGALTGLALIYQFEGKPKEALQIYRRVLTIAPQLKPIKDAVQRLSRELEQPM